MRGNKPSVGLGSAQPKLAIYIANRPCNNYYPTYYPTLNYLRPLAQGELADIVANNTNHWRKVFNVFAKFLWALDWPQQRNNAATTWQVYRDHHLLQAHSAEALLFSPPDLDSSEIEWHIVAGKTYAAALELPSLIWIDNYFAINKSHKVIVTPYLDYRQLSDARIDQLVGLMGYGKKG